MCVTLYYSTSPCIGPDDGHLMAETCCPFNAYMVINILCCADVPFCILYLECLVKASFCVTEYHMYDTDMVSLQYVFLQDYSNLDVV